MRAKTEFDTYRFEAYIPQSPQGRCCFISIDVNEEIRWAKQAIHEVWNKESVDEKLARNKRALEIERREREELLRGTLEERWQEALQADPDLVAKTVKNLKTRDEKKNKLVWAWSYSKAKQAEIAERVFKSELESDRALYRNLPPNTAQIITINGKRCLNTVRYERLPTVLVKEYATPTNGGVRMIYTIFCSISPDNKRGFDI